MSRSEVGAVAVGNAGGGSGRDRIAAGKVGVKGEDGRKVVGGECEVRKDAASGGGEMWRCDGEREGCRLTYGNSRMNE